MLQGAASSLVFCSAQTVASPRVSNGLSLFITQTAFYTPHDPINQRTKTLKCPDFRGFHWAAADTSNLFLAGTAQSVCHTSFALKDYAKFALSVNR